MRYIEKLAPIAGRLAFVVLLLQTVPGTGWSQSPADDYRMLLDANRLIDQRDFPAAVQAIQEYLARHPQDPQAALLLAQTLYWKGDEEPARAQFEAALRQHPTDVQIRLEYGRVLVQLHELNAARQILRPIRGEALVLSEAEALLGTVAYWQGDLATAEKHFRNSLRNSDNPDARRYLNEIRAASAAWIRFTPAVRTDNQPLGSQGFSAEAGWHLTPLQTLSLQAVPTRFSVGNSAETVTSVQAVHRGYWSGLRLESEIGAGLLQRSFSEGEADWVGRAALGIRLPQRFAVRGIVERTPYLYTTASLAAPVMAEAVQIVLARTHPTGWIGEASSILQRYPDHNTATTHYAWLLAPLVNTVGLNLRAGYAYSYQDAEESRFVLAPGQSALPVQGGLTGQYRPYYTPAQVQAHSVSASLGARLSQAATLHLSGSYGVHATENAPFIYPQLGADGQAIIVERDFYTRRFHPYTARAGVSSSVSPRLSVQLEAEHTRTAYWQASRLQTGFLYRFVPAVSRN